MRNDTGMTEASQQSQRPMRRTTRRRTCVKLSSSTKGIVAAHPDTQEAGYSRSQIQNIIKEVVPERDLFEAQVGMAMAHFGGDRQQEIRIPVAPVMEAGA